MVSEDNRHDPDRGRVTRCDGDLIGTTMPAASMTHRCRLGRRPGRRVPYDISR